MARYPHVNKANKYAREVLSGKILACNFVKLACQRHQDDLDRSTAGKFPYKFDKDKAEEICEFTELQVHVKGEWAGQNIVLEPFQCFIYCSIFGWVYKNSGKRRFRTAYCEIPRKNGKSVLAACVGNYMFLADGEAGAEVYSGASTEKQAWEVFRPSKLMIERSQGIKSSFRVGIHAKTMSVASTASRYEPVIGSPGDGSSPHCAIVDEYHEHKTSDLFDTMDTGMGARSQPLMFVITTAGSNMHGPCKALHGTVEKVLKGTISDESLFGIIYAADEDDDWTDFEVWKKANPNFGISVKEDFLRKQLLTATQQISRQNIIRCKHLNNWLTADTAWMDIVRWNKCKNLSLTIESVKQLPCILALDLASKLDLAALMLLFWDDNKFYVLGKYYLPRETVDLPQNQHYQTWELEEHLTVTPGAVTDYGYIEDDIVDFNKKLDVRGVVYDPFQATYLVSRLLELGLPMIELGAQVKTFSEPMKDLEKMVFDETIVYDGDPVLTWAMSNVVAHYDKKDNIFPNKEHAENKIDPVVALIMANNIVMRLRTEEPEEEPEIIFI